MSSWKILHVNTEREWRGGEAQTLLLARGLMGRGHLCRVAAPAGSPLSSRSREAGVPTVPFESGGEMNPASALRLARILRSDPPDLVHYHTSHAVTLGAFASLLAGRRPAVASRRVSFSLSRNPLARFKYTFRVDRIIAVSEDIREILAGAGVPADRVKVIHSAVDLDRFGPALDRAAARREAGVAEGDFLVGAVGALAAHKGHAVLIEAARGAVPRNPALRFLIAGTGEREADLRRRIEAAGLSSIFRLIGFRGEIERLLPAFDLLAFPSLSGEGSPAVPKEAMACGVPVVASDISGVREVVRHEREGLLVPAGNAAALAEAILRLARDPVLRVEFQLRGRERSRDFGIDRLVERTEAFYAELLEWKRRRR